MQIPEAILRERNIVDRRTDAAQWRGAAAVDHADVDDRVLTDRLRQKRKGKRALLLFEVDAFDLVAVLRDQARLARQNVRDIIADARDLV